MQYFRTANFCENVANRRYRWIFTIAHLVIDGIRRLSDKPIDSPLPNKWQKRLATGKQCANFMAILTWPFGLKCTHFYQRIRLVPGNHWIAVLELGMMTNLKFEKFSRDIDPTLTLLDRHTRLQCRDSVTLTTDAWPLVVVKLQRKYWMAHSGKGTPTHRLNLNTCRWKINFSINRRPILVLFFQISFLVLKCKHLVVVSAHTTRPIQIKFSHVLSAFWRFPFKIFSGSLTSIGYS